MYLLKEKIEGKVHSKEEITLNLIRRGRPLQEIHEDTGLSLKRIQQLAKNNENTISTQE